MDDLIKTEKIHALGLMSGTSLDGLDIAHCIFFKDHEKWNFEIAEAETFPYPEEWKKRIQALMHIEPHALAQAHKELGIYYAEEVHSFIRKYKLKDIAFIASHGHTVFHQPEKKLTVQIGDGAEIASSTGITTVCDFRVLDVELGGQGAPLVPIGDKYLFPQYSHCLNLGGIANISYDLPNKERVAFDICPCNIPLNYLAVHAGKEYDENGKLASGGHISIELLAEFNNLEYYKKSFPKSLGKEWVDDQFITLIEKSKAELPDKLRSVVEHIAMQVAEAIRKNKAEGSKLLITGGGAFNTFLVERIKSLTMMETVIPSEKIIGFKEALVFAFLGLLKTRGEINTLKSVTGARKDSSGGTIYYGSNAASNTSIFSK